MSLQSLCSQTLCSIQQMSAPTPDVGGSWVSKFVDLWSPVPTRIEDASAARILEFQRYQLNVTHEIFHQQVGVRVGMRFVNLTDGRPYLVHANINNPATGKIPSYYISMCEEQISESQAVYAGII